jgi:hypothetical protein
MRVALDKIDDPPSDMRGWVAFGMDDRETDSRLADRGGLFGSQNQSKWFRVHVVNGFGLKFQVTNW